jgi:hypothetical protein
MNIYLINALLVLLVLRQIHEHQLDLRALAVPVLAIGAAAVMFLCSVPGGAFCMPRYGPVPLRPSARAGAMSPPGPQSYGDWVPAAQVPDGLAVFPLDGVFE